MSLSLSIQFDLLEQLGYEGYSLLVNTSELQSHVMATSKGKAFHKMRQQLGKPLENPFIGYVFSEDSGKSDFHLPPLVLKAKQRSSFARILILGVQWLSRH